MLCGASGNKMDNNEEKLWIVHQTSGEGLVELISKGRNSGIIPIGTFLTVEDGENKFFLRVERSVQEEIFKPSVLLVEADLELPNYEQKIKNIIYAKRINETNLSSDDSSSFIKPGLIAKRSTQEEINMALNLSLEGVPVFLATSLFGRANILKGLNGAYITARLPIDAFYHQMIIAGKTGSGKTTALKYLAQYFTEEMDGAVIAVNVKGKDLLYMGEPSDSTEQVENEWKYIGAKAHGVDNTTIYLPYSKREFDGSDIQNSIIKKISLSVDDIEPETLTALMHNRLSEIAETVLPDIFRWWLEEEKNPSSKFSDFVEYFNAEASEQGTKHFKGKTVAGEKIEYPIATGTYNVLLREINQVSQYFDAPKSEAEIISIDNLIQKGSLSILHLTNDKVFGSILLRHIIKKVIDYMPKDHTTPVLFIIDETHTFYDSRTSQDALNDLSVVCRTGRQYKTAIIFASQSPRDIPQDLESVVATKIFFQSERKDASGFGLGADGIDVETLPKGACVAKIYDQPYLRLLKFPMAFAGVKND